MITQRTRIHLFLISLYYVLLTIAYRVLIFPRFEYQGFSWQLNPLKFVFGLAVLLVFYLLFLQIKRSVSLGALSIFYVMALVPAAVVYSVQDQPLLRFLLYSGAFFGLAFFLKLIPMFSFGRIRIPRVTLVLILLLFSISVTTGLIINNGMNWGRAFDLSQTYDIRSQNNYGLRVMYYFVPWVYRIVNIVLIIHALSERKRFLLLFVISIQLMIFMSTAHKIILFDLMAIIFIYCISNSGFYLTNLLTVINIGVIGTFVLEYIFTALQPMLSSLAIRRILLLPAQITYQYMEYFDTHVRLFLTHSVFRRFAQSSCSMEIPRIIGKVYYNNANSWVNTGWVGDAYMNFGALGILLFSAGLALFIKIMDSVQIKGVKGETFSVVLGALIALLLINGAFLTSLLSHGLFLLFLICLCIGE